MLDCCVRRTERDQTCLGIIFPTLRNNQRNMTSVLYAPFVYEGVLQGYILGPFVFHADTCVCVVYAAIFPNPAPCYTTHTQTKRM